MFAVEHVDYPVKVSGVDLICEVLSPSHALFSISASECCEICYLPQYELTHHALLVLPL
ncbi:unnamed protein product [Musa acuminata subsp. burmannicoides]